MTCVCEQAKQLRTVQRFNVVTHVPMYPDASDPKDRPPQPHPYRKKSAATFNIISNLANDNNNNNNQSNTNHTPTASPSSSKRPTRDFNILTNKYHEQHDTRAELEAAKKKEIAAINYNKTRVFDAVRITFVDEQREQQFVQQRAEEQQVHGQERVLLLPPREQFAEGRLYNILNQRVINADKLAAMSEKDQRALNKMQKSAFETKMRSLGEETLAKETALCLNRYAHERNSQSYVHGFDPISNEPFEGRHAKATMPTRTHAALSAWQVLERGVPLSTKIASSPPQKPATASVLVSSSHAGPRESQSNYHHQPTKHQLSISSSDEHQRPNILVVDHAPSSSAQRTPVQVRIAFSPGRHEPLVFVSDTLWTYM